MRIIVDDPDGQSVPQVQAADVLDLSKERELRSLRARVGDLEQKLAEVLERPRARITFLQSMLGGGPVQPKTRVDYLRIARWWRLESMRTSAPPAVSAHSRRYADEMRARAEAIG